MAGKLFGRSASAADVAPDAPAAPMPAHGFVPPGHFYSPIPDWDAARKDSARIFRAQPSIPGIDMRDEAQCKLLHELAGYYHEIPFADQPNGRTRYYYQNSAYSYCDAIFLYGMLRHLRPKRLVEIGSGFSSCVTLDTNDLFLDGSMELTFVEPYPELLHSLLRESDRARVRIEPKRLQDVDIDVFSGLRAGDILFVDSTHVSKIDSDVNRIIFEILPALDAGVYVHFHDIFYPFEYPQAWVDEGRAWNEIYLLRAFLQYNVSFEVVLMSTFLAQFHAGLLAGLMPDCMKNPGGNIWLRKTLGQRSLANPPLVSLPDWLTGGGLRN